MGLFAEPGPWFYLDPDYRRDAPKDTALFCCRCQKRVSGATTLRVVEVDWDKMMVRNNPLGKELIGSDCWKQITKDNS